MSRRAAMILLAALLMLPGCDGSGSTHSARARAFAALPDWTGLWETAQSVQLQATGKLVPPQLWGKPPYNPQWLDRTRGAASVTDSNALSRDLPPATKSCGPSGFPAVMEFPVPDLLFEMLVTPEQTLLVSSEGTIRHIYTDGRGHPTEDAVWPTPEGHSIGRWEGDTLVIDTIARAAGPVGPWPDAALLSEQARFTERLRRPDPDHLLNEMTIEDPQRLARPWQLTIHYSRVRNLDRLVPVNCSENDRNPVVDGQFVITPPAR